MFYIVMCKTCIHLLNSSSFLVGFFNLQGVTVSRETTGTEMVCLFAVNSTARGCFLALSCVQDQNTKCEFVVARTSASALNTSHLVTGCQPSCSLYNLDAYDIFPDGSRDSKVAVTLKNISVPYLRHTLLGAEATGMLCSFHDSIK